MSIGRSEIVDGFESVVKNSEDDAGFNGEPVMRRFGE